MVSPTFRVPPGRLDQASQAQFSESSANSRLPDPAKWLDCALTGSAHEDVDPPERHLGAGGEHQAHSVREEPDALYREVGTRQPSLERRLAPARIGGLAPGALEPGE